MSDNEVEKAIITSTAVHKNYKIRDLQTQLWYVYTRDIGRKREGDTIYYKEETAEK